MKRLYLKRYPPDRGDKPPIVVVLGCGCVSSVCGQLSSYPLALVKTKLQANSKQIAICCHNVVFTASGNISDGPVVSVNNRTLFIMRQTVAQEGLPGLYRGMAPNFLKAVPAVSISYVVYEHVREALGGHMT